MEVGRDLAVLGDVEESEADEEGFHLGLSKEMVNLTDNLALV